MNVPILLAVASLVAGGLVAFTSQFGVRNGADIASFILVDAITFLALAVLVMLVTKSTCLLYTSPSPRDGLLSRMPSSA